MLVLNINKKEFMGSPMAMWHLTLDDLERSKSRSLRFESLISRKGGVLGHMLLLTINNKLYKWGTMPPSYLTLSDLVRSWGHSQGIYVTHIYLLVIVIWISHKTICGQAGYSTDPAVFLIFIHKSRPNQNETSDQPSILRQSFFDSCFSNTKKHTI